MPNKEDEIGALWESAMKDGRVYMTGKVGDIDVVGFRNDYKKPGERSPDWRLYKRQPRENQPQPEQPKPQPSYPPRQVEIPTRRYEEDDIPF